MQPPICKHLRTKKMYIPAQADEVTAQPGDHPDQGACHCWCNLTLTVVGADDQPVHIDSCRLGRVCYVE